MARRKRVRKARAVRRRKVAKAEVRNVKLALVVLVFGTATAASAVYRLGNVTILLGLVTVAAVIAMLAKRK